MKLFEFDDPFGRQQVAAGREDLAQLDEGGAQRLQGKTRALWQIWSGSLGGRAPLQRLQPQSRQKDAQPEAGGDLNDLLETVTVAGGHEQGLIMAPCYRARGMIATRD